MKKAIYTSIFCTILGLCINTPANASLISRGFLDQALTDYATTTALDLKADQSDFTDLNTQISDSVDVLRDLLEQNSSSYEFVNYIDPEKFPNTISGAFGLLYQYLDAFASSTLRGWTDSTGTYYRGFADLNNGWTDSESNTYLGVKGLNDKIGTLPSGDMRPSKGLAFLVPSPAYTYPTTIGDSIFQLYSGTLGLSGLADAVYNGNTFMGQTDTTLQVKGLRQITDEIGTLPRGSLINQTPFTDDLYKSTQGTESPVYPNSMAELVKQIYGEFSSSVIQPGLVHILITGFPNNGILPINSDEIGILPAISLAENASSVANTANETAQANATKIGTVPDGKNLAGMISETDAKIGTLPSGEFPIFPGFDRLFPGLNQPLTYPTSLAELITAIYGNSETGAQGLLSAIITGLPMDTNNDGQFDSVMGTLPNFNIAKSALALANSNATKIGPVPDGKNLAGMISETDARIGDLPTEYTTVGAALSAIKGIAEEAKAAALAAIPDPKTEGSNGKYVLTVDIVGDNATYRWEPIDRGDTTPTTE